MADFKLKGSDLYDSHSHKVATVRGNDICDGHSSKIGTMNNVTKKIEGATAGTTTAALWVFFAR